MRKVKKTGAQWPGSTQRETRWRSTRMRPAVRAGTAQAKNNEGARGGCAARRSKCHEGTHLCDCSTPWANSAEDSMPITGTTSWTQSMQRHSLSVGTGTLTGKLDVVAEPRSTRLQPS